MRTHCIRGGHPIVLDEATGRWRRDDGHGPEIKSHCIPDYGSPYTGTWLPHQPAEGAR